MYLQPDFAVCLQPDFTFIDTAVHGQLCIYGSDIIGIGTFAAQTFRLYMFSPMICTSVNYIKVPHSGSNC